jgi:SAM-dependent methyltransferase
MDPVKNSAHSKIHSDVQHYYGQILQDSQDLKTSACCAAGPVATVFQNALAKVPSEIKQRFYGCGTPFPSSLEGCRVLDLGCGTGRDVYVLSQLVGPEGLVIGIDMTANQLDVAKRYEKEFTASIGYKQSNMAFHLGYMEDLAALDIADNSIDVVVSNCVFNLSPRKDLVLSEIARVLKPGGELYFSDVFVDRRLPSQLTSDPVIVGECLGGAMYFQDFRRAMTAAGMLDFRVVTASPVDITDSDIKQKLMGARFQSITVRAFKLDLEDTCEDYGQAARYLGTDPQFPQSFELDQGHSFATDQVVRVCRNSADMLIKTRLAKHFEVYGKASTHLGLFSSAQDQTKTSCEPLASGSCC